MSGDYTAASTLIEHGGTSTLTLATALGVTPDGLVDNPTFFSGFPDRPDVLAAGLLAVADVAGTRYADFGLAQRVANLDPVVTAGGDVLRFESFSACNGVYARLDVLAEGLGASTVGFGTTNVDINGPLRAALARTSRTETLHLTVGHENTAAPRHALTVEQGDRLGVCVRSGLVQQVAATLLRLGVVPVGSDASHGGAAPFLILAPAKTGRAAIATRRRNHDLGCVTG